MGKRLIVSRSASPGACNYPIFLSRRLHRPTYFSLNSNPHRNLSDQLQSFKHGLIDDISTWCWHVLVRPHCFIITEACSCRLELPILWEKYLKIGLCKNAIALACYESCRLLVIGSCTCLLFAQASCCIRYVGAGTKRTPLHGLAITQISGHFFRYLEASKIGNVKISENLDISRKIYSFFRSPVFSSLFSWDYTQFFVRNNWTVQPFSPWKMYSISLKPKRLN